MVAGGGAAAGRSAVVGGVDIVVGTWRGHRSGDCEAVEIFIHHHFDVIVLKGLDVLE